MKCMELRSHFWSCHRASRDAAENCLSRRRKTSACRDAEECLPVVTRANCMSHARFEDDLRLRAHIAQLACDTWPATRPQRRLPDSLRCDVGPAPNRTRIGAATWMMQQWCRSCVPRRCQTCWKAMYVEGLPCRRFNNDRDFTTVAKVYRRSLIWFPTPSCMRVVQVGHSVYVGP